MLKALELSGFKSFADKTRFEFPSGITVIVGPNGSGKSNVVDALRWVLGEQSVKSLRGKDMVDVIFNGSAGRRAQNSAEVTLTFDNSSRRFALDTPEIHVTRRVYRSGEAEYLLNRQACRLRDIRDLFSGTGVATEAYSIIEQGKVDVLLQASPRDRRIIFEEAAGISRFKAKKIESIRRLERIDQNLLRLRDIVEEVENRLRSVRMQAAKAQRYKELADRLQALRTQVGWADWRAFSRKLAEVEAEIETLRSDITGSSTQAEVWENRVLQHDLDLVAVEEALRTHEGRLHQNRQRIAVLDAQAEYERVRCRDFEEQVQRHRRQAVALSIRAGDIQQLLRETDAEVFEAETRHRDICQRLADAQRSLTSLTAQLDLLRNESQQRRGEYQECIQRIGLLGTEISGLEAQLAAAGALRQRDDQRLRELQSSTTFLTGELQQIRVKQIELTAAWEVSSQNQLAAQQQLAETRRALAEQQQALAQWRQLHAGAVERTRVLEELERRLEGIHTGVKELLLRARSVSSGSLTAVRGLVADLLRVPVEIAPLLEIALGERSQFVVINTDCDLRDVLNSETARLAGRVGFLRLDGSPLRTELPDLKDQPGILGRADQFIETDAEFQPLAQRLLGQTWLVDQFSQALALSEGIGRGQQFLTRKGEQILPDGTIVVGPRSSGAGLISRRSELRALKLQLAEFERNILQHETQAATLAEQLQADESRSQQATHEHQQAMTALAEQRQQTKAAEERLAQLAEQTVNVAEEAARTAARIETDQRELEQSRSRLQESQAGLAALQAALERDAKQLEEFEVSCQQLAKRANSDQIELAKSEQRLEDLRARRRQYEKDQQERQHTIAESHRQSEECETRRQQAERNILTAESEIAELYLRKEAFTVEAANLLQRREQHRQERAELTQEAQRIRNRIRRVEEKLHKRELVAGEIQHERTTLADRLREDYGIELAELERDESAEEGIAREEIEREIADLRQKLNQIGGVNLDALQELEELEQRFTTLSTQYQDLSTAKVSLEQIIEKINADSRRLFAETLETVRGHFQNLFRKLFGGGQADIVLDEGADILESGIEIIARPPGKELRSISLMSGGEKTLTAVALLLSIFRSRPSPFCVLDEVDAALDEANINRFIEVLKEFLAWTQFVVVTHSKKTMTCASTLYGVTMQESGISKRVSVRFEDVSDNGEIRVSPTANKPDADDTQAA